MAAAGSLKGIGVPVKLLHEAEGHIVTVRLRGTGEKNKKQKKQSKRCNDSLSSKTHTYLHTSFLKQTKLKI
jgi:hypothetical protein